MNRCGAIPRPSPSGASGWTEGSRALEGLAIPLLASVVLMA
jgi:hypothetical protein